MASFDDTARTLGAGGSRLFFGVHAQLLTRSVLAAFLPSLAIVLVGLLPVLLMSRAMRGRLRLQPGFPAGRW